MSSVGLLALGVKPAQLDGAFKYLTLNLAGTLLLLMAVALIYAATGHLNFAALHARHGQIPEPLRTSLVGLLVLSCLVKAGAFPFFAWLPASYHTLPGPILALFAGLLTKVGVYAVLRTLGGVFSPAPEILSEMLGWIAAMTMLLGVLGAAYHWDVRRILAFHIISQIGYIFLGVAMATQAGKAAALFYTLHHIIVKSNLFFIGALVARHAGSYDLRQVGGLYKACPLLSVVFLVPALSLVGIPPLSGFWAKFLILSESLNEGRYLWTAVALVVSVLTLYSMIKIWIEAFWKPHPDPDWSPDRRGLSWAFGVTMGLALVTLWIGFQPGVLAAYARLAARTLEVFQ
jgi:multicomponent Na+:H+ antiporter subunit D